MYHQFKELAGVDITAQPMEVGPTCHYMMGGVRVDAESEQSTVPGLFAAGEVAGGMHGANRLGGNSLGDILVFGRRAGVAAAEFARTRGADRTIDEREVAAEQTALFDPLDSSHGWTGRENPYHLHEALQAAMQDDAGIGRSEESLQRALSTILELRERSTRMRVVGHRELNPGWHTCRDVTFMLTVSESIVRSALRRQESRGSQWRFDFLEQDAEQGKVNYVSRRDGGAMKVEAVALSRLPDTLVPLLARSRFYDPAKLPKGYLQPDAMPAAVAVESAG
jgi:succinate dehydrogenase / fumarate reductase flavoprotein subunit